MGNSEMVSRWAHDPEFKVRFRISLENVKLYIYLRIYYKFIKYDFKQLQFVNFFKLYYILCNSQNQEFRNFWARYITEIIKLKRYILILQLIDPK